MRYKFIYQGEGKWKVYKKSPKSEKLILQKLNFYPTVEKYDKDITLHFILQRIAEGCPLKEIISTIETSISEYDFLESVSTDIEIRKAYADVCRIRNFRYIETLYANLEEATELKQLTDENARKLHTKLTALTSLIVNEGKQDFTSKTVVIEKPPGWAKEETSS